MTQDGKQPICENVHKINNCERTQAEAKMTQSDKQSVLPAVTSSCREAVTNSTDEKYWQMRFEHLQKDYEHLQKINQNLENKLLNVVEEFQRKKEELEANVVLQRDTLMADVNKLSDKLVDARMKLLDYEENESLHVANCDSSCHRDRLRIDSKGPPAIQKSQIDQMRDDPNLI